MKNLIVIISACLFIFYACSNENEKNNSGSHRSDQKSEHYLNYDFELDIKSTTTVDTVAFRNEMNKILSPKRIVELFGSGYQVFYLLLEINADGTNIFKISPEAGSWLTGWSRFERGLFKENLELSK
ncbi:MAG: hypothetical protein Q8S39_01030, partial [Ignavibacteria bacterium]|nr:hypothetical protein [Ignavibacteria bacterium]